MFRHLDAVHLCSCSPACPLLDPLTPHFLSHSGGLLLYCSPEMRPAAYRKRWPGCSRVSTTCPRSLGRQMVRRREIVTQLMCSRWMWEAH